MISALPFIFTRAVVGGLFGFALSGSPRGTLIGVGAGAVVAVLAAFHGYESEE